MFRNLYTVSEVIKRDTSATASYGIPAEMLIENAGRSAFNMLYQCIGSMQGKKVHVFAGSGNNGADGIVLARYLHNAGAEVLVLLHKEASMMRPTAQWHWRVAAKQGVPFLTLSEFYRSSETSVPDCIVDALLGVGFEGVLQQAMQEHINYINTFVGKSTIIALDIPSGLHALYGTPQPISVYASHTLTFDVPKVGLYTPDAVPFVGDVHVCTIGLPEPEGIPSYQAIAAHPPKPSIDPMLYKNTAGKVLVIGSSIEYPGAGQFCAEAALRMGSGLVTLATLSSVIPNVQCVAQGIMLSPVAGECWNKGAIDALYATLHTYDVIVIGMGMGRGEGVRACVTTLLGIQDRPPVILDADALHVLSVNEQDMALIQQDDILTPHIGELAQLLSTSTAVVKEKMLDIATLCKHSVPATVVMKKNGAIITSPHAPITLAPAYVPNLAVGGSGDILAGMIAALRAQGKNSFQSAVEGCYYHSQVGEYLKKKFPFRGNTPKDIVESIPAVLSALYE